MLPVCSYFAHFIASMLVCQKARSLRSLTSNHDCFWIDQKFGVNRWAFGSFENVQCSAQIDLAVHYVARVVVNAVEKVKRLR